MKKIDLTKIFWSKCRTKIFELFFLEHEAGHNDGFHMRAVSRETEEQINSVKRELEIMTELWFLKFREEGKKKMFYINDNFLLLDELKYIFLKTYDPSETVKKFFSEQEWLSFVMINESLRYKIIDEGKAILDIFLIWDMDKDIFNDFLKKTFFNRKIKYAQISINDLKERLQYGDKLIQNILSQKGNKILIDKIGLGD